MQGAYRRILTPARGSFFLFGPRGCGKSTWLRASFPEAHRVDLLDEAAFQAYLADPGRLGAELRARPAGSLIVVDEVQRLPALLNEVHRQMEERRLRFVLCGSSARKLKTSGTNLLAGRAAVRNLHALVPEELGEDFDLDQVLRFGTLAVIWRAPDRRDALESYARLYLREEIQAEALVRNLASFARFLPVAALMHGQVMNVSSLARDAGVPRNTVATFLGVLEDTLVTFSLPAYEARLRVRERRHPKLYWVDPGLPRAIRGNFHAPSAEERGALFEGWVAALLRAYRDYRRLFDDWGYWASGGAERVEVDFLLRQGDRLVAIEAKAAARVHEGTFAGLRAVAALAGLKRRIVVHPGQRPARTADGIDILPVGEFLREVESGSLFGG